MLLTCWAIALFFVMLITLGAFGYGLAITKNQRLLPSSLINAPILGLGLLTTLSLFSGIAGYYNAPIQLAIILVGLVLFAVHRGQSKAWWQLVKSAPFDRRDFLWLLLPLLYYLSRFFTAGLPQQHSDPLYYHLLAPKFWAQGGHIQLTPEHPSFAQATLWELLFGMPLLWLKALQPLHSLNTTDSLITTQLTSQWLHMLWGQGGCLVLGIALMRRFLKNFPLSLGPQVFIAWLCTSLPSLEWTGVLAKNDYILLLFLLASVIEVYSSRAAAAGIFMGLAYSTKMFAFWTGLALFILIPRRQWPQYIVYALIALMPIVIRNFLFTGNPMFPVFDDRMGPYWISNGWKKANETFAGPPKLDSLMLSWLWFRGLEKALPKTLIAIAVLGISFIWKKTKKFPLKREIVFTFFQLICALTILKSCADGRYASPIFILFLLMVIGTCLPSLPLMKGKLIYLFLPLGLLVRTPIEAVAQVSKQFLFQSPDTYINSFHTMQPTHQWVSTHVKPNEKILFTYDKINYYLDHNFECVTEMKKWENLFLPINNPEELFSMLREQGYRYLQFAVDISGYPTFSKMNRELATYKNQAVFLTSTSMILDLQNLKKSL